MWAVLVTVQDEDSREAADVGDRLLYGPYKTRAKAEDVQSSLIEQAIRRAVEIDTEVIPLVRTGLAALLDKLAEQEGQSDV